MTDRWQPGQLITRREVLGYEPTHTIDSSLSWFDKSWLDMTVRVVKDDPDELVLYVPTGSPMFFPEHQWPIVGGRHPWIHLAESGWQGPGCLMWHRPGEHHAVWHFYDGPDRVFRGWYVNVQTAFRRGDLTFETQDLELDFPVGPDHRWQVKDWDAVDDRVAEGRYSPECGAWIHEYGRTLIDRLERKDFWWPESWAQWEPPVWWDKPSTI